MNLQSLKERVELLEATLKQHMDQINALNGHLAESKYWMGLLEAAEKAATEYVAPVVDAIEEAVEA
jgi:uncharacterized coiled-coil protein SlyX